MPESKKKKEVTKQALVEEPKLGNMVKKVKDFDKEFLVFKCTAKSKIRKKECGNKHFRHAGYMEFLVPFIKSTKEGKVQTDSVEVKVCTKCKACYIYMDSNFIDVTGEIDIKAWEDTEKELHKATGPGGQC